jgi:hypothetical protein
MNVRFQGRTDIDHWRFEVCFWLPDIPSVGTLTLIVCRRAISQFDIPSINPNEVRAPPIDGWGMTEYLITLATIGIVIILIAEN